MMDPLSLFALQKSSSPFSGANANSCRQAIHFCRGAMPFILNAKCRVQNAECKVQNAKCKMKGRFAPIVSVCVCGDGLHIDPQKKRESNALPYSVGFYFAIKRSVAETSTATVWDFILRWIVDTERRGRRSLQGLFLVCANLGGHDSSCPYPYYLLLTTCYLLLFSAD